MTGMMLWQERGSMFLHFDKSGNWKLDTIIVWFSPFPLSMGWCHPHSGRLFPASIHSPWKCPHGHTQMCASQMPLGFLNPFELTMKTHQHTMLSETAMCRKMSTMWPHSSAEYKKGWAHRNRVSGGKPKMGRGWSYSLIRISSFRTQQVTMDNDKILRISKNW